MKTIGIRKLFSLVERETRKNRKKDLLFKGREFWHLIKPTLKKYDDQKLDIQWRQRNGIPKDEVKIIMTLPEYCTDGEGNRQTIADNHFLIQSVRIPIKETINLRKILQIALNIGQYT